MRLIFALALSINAVVAFGQTGSPLNSTPATQPEPRNLAEAAGKYIASVEQLRYFKSSFCGYALKRAVPTYEDVAREEIIPAFPEEHRAEVSRVLSNLKSDASSQSQALFNSLYAYYTKTEGLDRNTACGMMASVFITTRKLAAEAFDRKKALVK